MHSMYHINCFNFLRYAKIFPLTPNQIFLIIANKWRPPSKVIKIKSGLNMNRHVFIVHQPYHPFISADN